MQLNETEKRMLGGKLGKAPELAMNILSELGELYGAEKMIEISQVHIDMTLYMVDAGVEFAEKMADLGGRFAVPAQLNPASIDLIRNFWGRP
jgi:predicted aconitase